MIDILSMLDECEVNHVRSIDWPHPVMSNKYWFRFFKKYDFQIQTSQYNIEWFEQDPPFDSGIYNYVVEIFDDEMISIIKLMF